MRKKEPKTFKRPRLYYLAVWDRIRILYPDGDAFWSTYNDIKWRYCCYAGDTGEKTLLEMRGYDKAWKLAEAEFICEL